MHEKYIIDTINNHILNREIFKDSNIKIEGFDIADKPNVLAFYRLSDKNIYLNKTNKMIFNDFFIFLETILHENVHKINHANNVEDVDFEGEVQIHNKHFRNTMIEEYGLYCNANYNGEIDIEDSKNRNFFKETMKLKVILQNVFNEIQQIYFDEVYIEVEQGDNGYKEKDNKYIFEEEGGEVI